MPTNLTDRLDREAMAQPEPKPEVHYLFQCNGCGDVFDEPDEAAAHEGVDTNLDEYKRCIEYTSTGMIRSSVVFSLIREDEANF